MRRKVLPITNKRSGLLPGPWEPGLGLAMKEHGVDIATAVDTESAILQRVKGADVYIVGGWRYTPFLKWYGSKDITDISKLRGGKIGVKESAADGGGLVEFFIEEALKKQALTRTPKWRRSRIRFSATGTTRRM